MLAERDAGAAARLRPARRGIHKRARPTVHRAPRAPRGARRRPRRAKKSAAGSIELTPLRASLAKAAPWLEDGEGVIAKQLAAPYRPGERKGMVKVKRVRTADCVVVGWRPGKEEGTVGSLILGLYDERRASRRRPHLGLSAQPRSASWSHKLAPYETGERGSADPSRWAAERDLEWIALRPGARGRGELRPRQRRPDPPRHQGSALARRQGPEGLRLRPARGLIGSPAPFGRWRPRSARRAGPLHARAPVGPTAPGAESCAWRRASSARCAGGRRGRCRSLRRVAIPRWSWVTLQRCSL